MAIRIFSAAGVILATAAGLATTPSSVPHPVVRAVEIRVDNMAAAVQFYCGFLQFEKSGRIDTQDEISLSHRDAEILLKRVAKRSRGNFNVGSHVNLNMMVADANTYGQLARKSGFVVLDSIAQPAQIGSFYRVLDPAGNMVHLIEPNFDFGDLSKPAVFNLGIQVTDMNRSREFYFAKLGFAPLTEKYYPPVVPMNSSGIEMILHEGSTLPVAKRTLDETGISVVVEVPNFDSIARDLKLQPVKARSGQLELLAFDPDGNLLIVTNSR